MLSVTIKNGKELKDISDSLDENHILIFKGLKIPQTFLGTGVILDVVDFDSKGIFLKQSFDEILRLNHWDNRSSLLLLLPFFSNVFFKLFESLRAKRCSLYCFII
jgi:hypothetical protein